MATIYSKTPEATDTEFGAAIVSGQVDSLGDISIVKRSGTVVDVGSIGSDVISGKIDATGHLILTHRDGSTSDVGFVSRPIDTRPVGSVYITSDSTNPGAIFGGTWTRYAKGRVLAGLDENDTIFYNFDTVEKTGGEKNHLLTANETGLRDHAHSASTDVQGNHGHGVYKAPGSYPSGLDGMSINTTTTQSAWGGLTQDAGGHVHNVTVANVGSYDAQLAHNNLQPYITVYMWKRTA